MEALPDPPISYQSVSLLRRWNLCQALLRDFWKRWNISVDDVVLVREGGEVTSYGDCGESLETIAGRVAQNLGYDNVKAEQMKVIASVMHVRDFFCYFVLFLVLGKASVTVYDMKSCLCCDFCIESIPNKLC